MTFNDTYFGVIPHTYKNEPYDSWTESVWAAYFEAAGMPYQHEPHTFEYPEHYYDSMFTGEKTICPTSYYTPDFYLPEQDCYVEVKNGNAEREYWKIAKLARDVGKTTLILDGKPWNAKLYFYSPDSTYSEVKDNKLESTIWGHSLGSSFFPKINNRMLASQIQLIYAKTNELEGQYLRVSTQQEVNEHRERKEKLRQASIVIN